MKKHYIIAALVAAMSGTAIHFLYEISPNLFSALISPVNESVWEHLKLLFWPTLGAAAVLSARTDDKLRLWSGFLAALLIMPVFLVGVYELVQLLFGVHSLFFDIVLYYITMAGGFAFAYTLRRNGRLEKYTGTLLMLVLLYAACLILFTFAAPPVGIFEPPVNETLTS